MPAHPGARAHTDASSRHNSSGDGRRHKDREGVIGDHQSAISRRHARNQRDGCAPPAGNAGRSAVDTAAGPQSRHPGTVHELERTRAVAVATVSALRHQNQARSPARLRTSGGEMDAGHGGHDAPSWSRTTSASVLLACTALYAAIAGT